MRRIFKDDQLENQINKNGYVVVPVLNDQEVKEIKEIFDGLDAAVGEDFYLSIWSDNENYKNDTHQKIVKIVAPRVLPLLDNFKPVVSNFAVKYPGGKSGFDLHQGVNFVDETNGQRSITVWIPLQDVSPENGNMQIIRGTHKFFDQDVRSQHYQPPYSEIKPHIRKHYLENVPMKAGEAWIFTHRLLHCSPMNVTDKVRIATLNVYVPSECPVISYYKDNDDIMSKEVEILEYTEDNYYKQNVKSKPNVSGIVSRGKAYEKQYKLTEKEFDQLYEEYNPSKKGLLDKIKAIFD